jgi:hypothetical protein
MKMRKIFWTILAVSTFLAAASSNIATVESASFISSSSSAKCGVPPLKQAYAAANSVFIGKVTKVTQNERGKTFEFRAEKYWKGSKSKNIKVTVYESTRFQAFYQVGGKYLVFARAEENKLVDGRCSRSKDFSDAAEDIRGLGKSRKSR